MHYNGFKNVEIRQLYIMNLPKSAFYAGLYSCQHMAAGFAIQQ